ncbi:endolytic transglycosylase MltG [Nocardioides abyssi]|uniref:Endolytic murein transglycosylase n=1 Tax=Nocardioides abyssi TaxID=3058370 RepID=A0ABT8EUL3_9ACTN|nr:endolytic transglycosylase MltG [Nocardioides abyssi]MDN4161586.1 endolytic transglycosylase MltG [Nocardioides abyssi]
MSDPSQPSEPLLPGERPVEGGRRRRKRRNLPGCLAVLVALAIVAGGLWFAVTKGIGWVEDQFADPDDFAGPGTGKVAFEVVEGDSSAAICRGLKADEVVASVQACIDAASANPDSSGIQVGFYPLRREMAAEDAIDVLVDPANIVTNAVTVPEGLNVDQVVAILAERTEFGAAAFEKVLAQPDRIGLPDYADGNPEGYLFPSTYSFGPNAKPVDMVSAMVERWRQAADEAGLEEAADRLGYTPHELMTVASLVEAEGRGDDMPKVARVIYNRLENPDNGVTNGLLQIDAAVNYALDKSPIARLTTAEIDSVADSPYNTYKQPGLPPGPIEAPGDAAIKAATTPADGPWLFYVTVNLETGETKFTESYDEFLSFRGELDDYCANESDRC